MMTANGRDVHHPPTGVRVGLKLSDVDRVSSLLMSLFLLVGFAVLFMFLIWICDQLSFPPEINHPPPQVIAGGRENDDSPDDSFEPPGQQEVEVLTEIELAQSLQAVTDGQFNSGPLGTPSNDARAAGPSGTDEVPPFERWNLKFAAATMDAYAAQLDHYKIELGAIGGSRPGIDYVSKLAGGTEVRHSNNPAAEQRLYFRFTQASVLQRWDRALASRAGIVVNGDRLLMKFIPAELESTLAALELQHARSNGRDTVAQIAKTVFESRSDGSEYRFVVIEQRYR